MTGDADRDAWYLGKSFTEDWTSDKLHVWADVLAGLRDRRIAALEIGSFEGRSAIFWLNYSPRWHLTCVDPFEPGYKGRQMEAIRARFDENVAEYEGRVRKLRMHSPAALTQLRGEKESFELIYIDGSHHRDDVLVDSLLSWPLLKADGILIWDDYAWKQGEPKVARRPEKAVDLFLSWYSEEVTELHRGWQVIVKKTRPQVSRPAGASPDIAPP